jgi:hypothetical protein
VETHVVVGDDDEAGIDASETTAPPHGEARPTSFEGLELAKIMLERATRDAGEGAAP